MGMENTFEKNLRAQVARYMDRNDHGKVGKLARAAGVVRQTVKKFSDGGNVEVPTLNKLNEGLKKLSWYETKESRALVAGESREPYPVNDDIALILARRLQRMIDILVDPTVAGTVKGNDFLKFCESLTDSAQAYATLLEKCGDDKG